MARSNAAVIDFGSSTINVVIAEKGANDTFSILGKSEVEYSGFLKCEFLEPEEIINVLRHAISAAQDQAKMAISDVYVGVPGEFTTVLVREPKLDFGKKIKVSDAEVEKLFAAADDFSDNKDYMLINRSPIYYTNDDGKMLIEPRETKTQTLSGQLSFVLAQTKFTDFVKNALLELGINKVEFISSCLAESLYLLDPFDRDNFALLIDVGYLTTSVMLVRGEGLLYMKSFSNGGGHITADLMECFGVPFDVAEQLKRKISLTFAVTDTDKYEISLPDKNYSFSAKDAHEVVESRLDYFSKLLLKCIEMCEINFPSYINIKLTGGGISYIRGAKEYLGKNIGKNIELAKSPNPIYDEQHLSSTYAVVDIALRQKKTSKSFITKMFN